METPTGTTSYRKVIPELRWVLIPFAILAALATVVLFVYVTGTETYFAWTIASPVTAAILGSFYAGAFVLFAMTLAERHWANARAALPAPFALSTALLIATLMHLDRFRLFAEPIPAAVAWLWLIVYIVAPPGLVLVYLKQRRMRGDDPPRTRPVPPTLRWLMAALGVVMLAVGVAMFIAPMAIEPYWPWPLTPLTGRAIAAWLLGLAVAVFHGLIENDARRLRAGLVSLCVLSVCALLAIWRFPDEVRWESQTTWVLLATFALLALAGAAGALLGTQSTSARR